MISRRCSILYEETGSSGLAIPILFQFPERICSVFFRKIR